MKVLPHYGKYRYRQTIVTHDNGEVSHKMVKVPNDEIPVWDAEHDAAGRLRRRHAHTVDKTGQALDA
jgi:hypothetical protein